MMCSDLKTVLKYMILCNLPGQVNHIDQNAITIMTTTKLKICCYGDRKEVRFIWTS